MGLLGGTEERRKNRQRADVMHGFVVQSVLQPWIAFSRIEISGKNEHPSSDHPHVPVHCGALLACESTPGQLCSPTIAFTFSFKPTSVLFLSASFLLRPALLFLLAPALLLLLAPGLLVGGPRNMIIRRCWQRPRSVPTARRAVR